MNFAPSTRSPRSPASFRVPGPVRALAPASALLLGASLLLSACGKHDSTGGAASAGSGASQASAPAASASPASVASSTQAAADLAGAASGASPFSEGLKRADLMHVVFPKWRDANTPGARVVTVELPERDSSGSVRRTAANGAPALAESSVEIVPREVIRLDDAHAVMVTEGVEVDDSGARADSDASGAWLGAYFFRHDATGWTLETRMDGVDYLGTAGTYGSTSVARIRDGEFGLILDGGGCWQGFCGSWASVYGITPGRIANYASTVPVDGSNLGASGDCDLALKSIKGASDTDVTVTTRSDSPPACFDIGGKLTLATADDGTPEMRIRFDGAESIGSASAADSGDDAGQRAIHQTAVYRLRDGKYVLASGHNPIPPF